MPGSSGSDKVSDEAIIAAVAGHFALDRDMLAGRQRDKQTARARHIAIYLLREEAGLSLGSIGTLLGGKSRSTILHGYHRISSQIDKDVQLKQDLAAIRDSL